MLKAEEITRFWEEGYLVVEAAASADQLRAAQEQLAAWVSESGQHDVPYGELIDGRARFDLAGGHSAETPQLRRVNAPSEAADSFAAIMRDSGVTDAVADLIGPDVAFHHDKINLKLPGAGTEVGYHQDFGYTPHTNSDLVTALVMLDDMTPENGPLTVIPGSHKQGQISLWQDDAFTGTVAEEVIEEVKPREVQVTGKAGSVCLMHTLLLHGSAANRSRHSRSLYICVYAAADARPLAANPVPSPLHGEIVRGQAAKRARLTMTEVELPEEYGDSSFFDVQARKRRASAA